MIKLSGVTAATYSREKFKYSALDTRFTSFEALNTNVPTASRGVGGHFPNGLEQNRMLREDIPLQNICTCLRPSARNIIREIDFSGICIILKSSLHILCPAVAIPYFITNILDTRSFVLALFHTSTRIVHSFQLTAATANVVKVAPIFVEHPSEELHVLLVGCAESGKGRSTQCCRA